MHRSVAAFTVALALTAAACSAESSPVSMSTTTSTTTSTTSTTLGTATTTTTVQVDWSAIAEARWLVHGADGIRADTGQLVWETEVLFGPDTLARDRRGGFVWLDAAGLWWLPAGADRPTLSVAGVEGDLVDVVDTGSGLVARLGYVEPRYFDLETGETVDQPEAGMVGFDPVGNVPWRAANGLEAVIVGPEVELDDEGQPMRILEHARLVVTSASEVIADLPVGTVYEPYARVHDFDGQRVIVARGPFEPALPEETFTVLDLTCRPCATVFRASASWAAFTGADSGWDGIGVVRQYPPLVATPLASDEIPAIGDGIYLGFVATGSVASDRLPFDLVVWFTGEDANRAARDDGAVEVPVPNDFYIRNLSAQQWALPVDSSVVVTSVWYGSDAGPATSGVPVAWEEFVRIMNDDTEQQYAAMRLDPWWLTVEDGVIVALDEQYVP